MKSTKSFTTTLTTAIAAALLLVPAAAMAVEGDTTAVPASTSTIDVLPVLGSSLTVAVTTDDTGTIRAVTVDAQVIDREQTDNEVSFVYAAATETAPESTSVAFQDSDAAEAPEAAEATEAPEAAEAPEAPEAPEAAEAPEGSEGSEGGEGD